jgi:hypothetical protein
MIKNALGKDERMPSGSRDMRSLPKWALFAVFLITIPVPYIMIVVGGLVPMFFILFLTIQGLIVALPKFTAEGFWMLGILLAHVAILGGLLYVIAYGIHWFLFKILPRRYALFVMLGLVVALFVASTFQIYRLPGHNSSPPANILGIIRGLAA